MLTELAREHGDAFYVVDPERFRANLRDLMASWRAVHARTALGYSYKTNYLPLLCRIADEEGCHAEVVSGMEYELATRLGVRPERIIFNGPLKSEVDLEAALTAGALVNIDSLAEVDAIEAVAERHPGARLRVGLRCALEVSGGRPTRFGLDDDELAIASRRLAGIPGCDLVALHCHSSGVRSAASFGERMRPLLAVLASLPDAAAVDTLDIGGGLYGRLPEEMAAQLEAAPPSWDEVATVVGAVLDSAFPDGDGPQLMLEPGAAVVADALTYVCRVVALKRLGDRTVAVTSGSLQDIKATPNPMRLPARIVRAPVVQRGAAVTGPVDVTGYTCLESDVLIHGLEAEVAVGDLLAISNVGAYTNVFRPPFIRPAPAMLALRAEGGGFDVVRRAERLEDMLVTYDPAARPASR